MHSNNIDDLFPETAPGTAIYIPGLSTITAYKSHLQRRENEAFRWFSLGLQRRITAWRRGAAGWRGGVVESRDAEASVRVTGLGNLHRRSLSATPEDSSVSPAQTVEDIMTKTILTKKKHTNSLPLGAQQHPGMHTSEC